MKEKKNAEKDRFMRILETNGNSLEVERKILEIDAQERKETGKNREKIVDVSFLLTNEFRKK